MSTRQVTLNLPKELYDEIAAGRQHKDVSINQEIVNLIEMALAMKAISDDPDCHVWIETEEDISEMLPIDDLGVKKNRGLIGSFIDHVERSEKEQ